jgi:predicted acyltransferase
MGQAFFMFISGAAMAFSYSKRFERGASYGACLAHAVIRSTVLFFCGWALYMIYPPEGASSWAFLLDILPALAFGSLVAFLIIRLPRAARFAVSIGLILITELLYRVWSAPGFDQPFTPGHNFGAYLDMKLFGGVSPDQWVTFNIVPSAAFVIWGVLAGELLKDRLPQKKKALTLVCLGLAGVASGLALDAVTPMVRRLSTSSFIIASGGFCLLFLALSYWIIDMLKLRRWALIPLAVGMNPLFIFLFARSGGADWFLSIVSPFADIILGWAGSGPAQVGTAIGALALMCLLCLALYRKGIFLRV